MLDYPWAVQGKGQCNTIVMDDLGILAKVGAEGVLVMATPTGASVAIKILDGNLRATTLVGLTLLGGRRHAGHRAPRRDVVDAREIAHDMDLRVAGHGQVRLDPHAARAVERGMKHAPER